MAAQSMWRYPVFNAISTAFSTSCGAACHVPKPTAGILAPVLSVKVRLSDIAAVSMLSRLGVIGEIGGAGDI
jgi:hypothetical protein